MSLEGLRSDVQQINNYIIVEKKRKGCRGSTFRRRDKEQKEMTERLKGDKGEDGDQGEVEIKVIKVIKEMLKPTSTSRTKGIFRINIWALVLLVVWITTFTPILGGFTGLKINELALIELYLEGPLYSGMRESLTGETPSPKTNFFETINPFARLWYVW